MEVPMEADTFMPGFHPVQSSIWLHAYIANDLHQSQQPSHQTGNVTFTNDDDYKSVNQTLSE